MKSIFTYPNNLSTNYIDPNYDGDDTVGFQKRVKDLKDGNYKSWNGTAPTASVDNIMQALSKFNQHPTLEEVSGNNTFYKFWEAPLMQGDKELISENILSATAVDGTTSNIEFSGNHGFYQGQLMTLSGFNNSWSGLNGNDYYVKKIDADTIQLATDSQLNNLIEFYDLENCDVSSATAANPAVFTTSSHDLNDETEVTLSNFDGSFADLNGLNFYIQNSTSTTFNLSYDQAGNDILSFATTQDNVVIDSFKVKSDGKILVNINNAEVPQPDGAEVEFDRITPPVIATTTSVSPNNWLDDITAFTYYLKNTGTAFEYEIHTDDTSPMDENVDWTDYHLTPGGGTALLQKETDIELRKHGDDYIFRYTLTGTENQDLTGSILTAQCAAMLNNRSGELNSIFWEDTAYVERISGDVYETYTDAARTTEQTLNFDVVNADRVIRTSSDTMLHMPKKYDSEGVEITSSSFVMNNDYNIDLDFFDDINDETAVGPAGGSNYIKYKYWSTDQAQGALATAGVIPGNLVMGTLSRRTGTYDGNPVIDITSSDNTLTMPSGVSGSIYYGFIEDLAVLDTPFHTMRKSSGAYNTINNTLVDYLDGLFDADTAGVRETTYVVELGYYTGATPSASNFVASGNTMGAFFYRNSYGDDDRFNILFFDIDDDGNLLDALPTGTHTEFGIAYNQNNRLGFRTKLINCYDRDTSGGSSTTYTINNPIYSSSQWSGGMKIPTSESIFTDDNYSGQKCTVKTYDTSTTPHTLVNTYNNLALMFAEDVTTAANIQLLKLDSNGKAQDDPFDNWQTLYGGEFGTRKVEVILEDEQIWERNEHFGFETVNADNRLWVSQRLNEAIDRDYVMALQGDTLYNADSGVSITTMDVVNSTFTDATQGTVIEAYTPPTPNIIPLTNLTGATAGTLTIDTGEANRYRLSGVTPVLYGNTKYLQQTGASTYVNNAEIKDNEMLIAGATNLNTTSFLHWPSGLTVATNSSGYPTGFTYDSEFPGAFEHSEDIMFTLQTVADTYTPPALSTEAQEDVFDVDAQWDNTDLDFDVYSAADKTFPTTVTPSSVVVRTIAPTATTQSQNGTKYARTAGYSKYSIDVEYPAMTPEQYLEYNGFINNLNGQRHPFYFDIVQNGTKLLGDPDATSINNTRYKDDASAGEKVVLIEGFSSNQSNAIKQGELIIATDSKHGNIKTAGSSTDANVYGEAKFRYTTPLHKNRTAGKVLYKNPQHIIVSLDTDTVEVSRDTAGFYYLSLSFTADEWK